MKIIIEKNLSKIRNKKALEEAEHIFNHESKQGFLKSKGESKFVKFRDESIKMLIIMIKMIVTYIVKCQDK